MRADHRQTVAAIVVASALWFALRAAGAGQPAAAPSPSPTPTPVPTFAPLGATPSSLDVVFGQQATLRVSGVVGTLAATSLDPAVLRVVGVDQASDTVTVAGAGVGITNIALSDERAGQPALVWVRVAYQAGFPASQTEVRVTGNPASAAYVRQAAAAAAESAVTELQPVAKASVWLPGVTGAQSLPLDQVEAVSVPVGVHGDPYITVRGTTQVQVENVALPRIRPRWLMVSDYPETITENGVLFTAKLSTGAPERFMYYHFNQPGSVDRRILLKITNPGLQPALVQFIDGNAGPSPDILGTGAAATARFLVHEARNEGTLVAIPPQTTINLVDQEFPAGTLIEHLLQLRELSGAPLHLMLLVQDFAQPTDAMPADTALLQSKVKHARGIYRIPEFYYDDTYFVGGDPLSVPIGQIPLPNLIQGEALAGDYGVLQSITVTMVNRTGQDARVALFERPRGGAATATYLIDGLLVRSHPVRAGRRFKVHEYIVPAHGFVRSTIVTMPEGGSSYPLDLIVAPDDGSVAPGAPGSPIY